MVIAFLAIFIIIVASFYPSESSRGNAGGLLVVSAVIAALGTWPLGIVVALLFEGVTGAVKSGHNANANQGEKQSRAAAGEVKPIGEKLLPALRSEIQAKINKIERERDAAIAALESPYQQRMVEIAAEHERTLAEIAVRYPKA